MRKSLAVILLALLLLTMVSCGANSTIALNKEETSEPTLTTPPEVNANYITLDMLTFRAEVLEPDPNYYLRHEDALLFVYNVTPVVGIEGSGRFFINRNDSISVLDAHGVSISYLDVMPGAIVDISLTHYLSILTMDHPPILGAVLIQLVK